MNNLISNCEREIPVSLKAKISESFINIALKRQKGTFVAETEIKNEAISAVSNITGFKTDYLTAVINTDELRFQQNAPYIVDDIKEIKVTYEGNEWSCFKCNQLEARLVQFRDEGAKQLQDAKNEGAKQLQDAKNERAKQLQDAKNEGAKQLYEAIAKLRIEIAEREEMLVAAGELVSVLYKKLYSYAKKNGLPEDVDLGTFLKSSDPKHAALLNIRSIFQASLASLGISQGDFEVMRNVKQARNQLYYSYQCASDLVVSLQATTLEEFKDFVNIVVKYPIVFEI